DVAQVVGAGYAVSDLTGNIATTVKLLRVALLLPVVVIVAWCFRGPSGEGRYRGAGIPMFALGFVAMVGLNSLEVIPAGLHDALSSLSRWLLVAAIAAIGMLTSLKSVTRLGFQHIAIVVGETAWLAAIVLSALIVFR